MTPRLFCFTLPTGTVTVRAFTYMDAFAKLQETHPSPKILAVAVYAITDSPTINDPTAPLDTADVSR